MNINLLQTSQQNNATIGSNNEYIFKKRSSKSASVRKG